MSTKEEHAPPVEPVAWSAQFDALLAGQRRQARERLDERRAALERLEHGLTDRLTQLEAELARHRQAIDRENESLEQRRAELERQRDELTALRADAERRRAEWEQTQAQSAQRHEEWLADLRGQLEELRAARTAQEAAERKLADDRREVEARISKAERLDEEQARLAEQAERLEHRERALNERGERLNHQRRHVASQLRARRAELTAEIDRRRAEVERLAAGGDLQLQTQAAEAAAQCERLREELARREQQIESLHGEIAELRERIGRGEAERLLLEQKLAELTALQSSQEQLAAELEQERRRREEVEAERQSLRDALEQRRQELESQRQAVQAQTDEITRREAELQQQRRRIASEFRAQRADLRAEHERQKADYEKAALERQTQLQVELAEARANQDQLREYVNESKERAERIERELAEQRHASQQHASELQRRLDQNEEKLQAARDEVESLRADLASASAKAPAPASTLGERSEELDHLQRRFEMAVQEVRELKAKNADLEKQLEKARKGGPAPSKNETISGLDWAAQKARMLAKLEESDDENSTPQAKADRLTIEETIRRTDEIIAAKDREIADLKRMLDQQSSTLGEVAVGAQAIANLLDSDEIIRQERENLQKLQDEWREMVRQSEVEISLERAKLARERTKLEEQIQQLEAARERGEPLGGGDGKRPNRNRWLTRLGLKEDEE